MERKEGGQVTDEKTKSPENREAQLRNAVTERGIRLTAGGEFLDTINPQNTQQQTELTRKVSAIVDGKEAVDPRIAQAIGLYSDQDRANHWGNTPFEQAYQQAQDTFTEWAISTKTLENTDERSVYEDTVTVLGQLGVTIENFATLSQGDRNNQFDHLYTEYYAKGTQIEAIGNAFLRTARNTDDTVDVLLLQRRLDSLDVFLNTCGTEAKASVREYVLKQGFINGDKQAKDIFKQAASTVVHATSEKERDTVLMSVYEFYKKIAVADEQQEQPHQPEPSLAVPANEEQHDIPIIQKPLLPMTPTSSTAQNQINPTEEQPFTMPEERIISIPSSAEQTEEEQKPESREDLTPQAVTLIPNEPSELKQRENINSLPFPKKTTETENSIIGTVGFAERTHTPKGDELNDYIFFSEDNKINDSDHGLFAVFDGVGGYRAGEYASKLAAESIGQSALASLPDTTPVDKVEQVMRQVLREVNQKISSHEERVMAWVKEKGKSKAYEGKTEKELLEIFKDTEAFMATTATVVKLLPDGVAVIGNIGDCRAYILRSNKQVDALEELTVDNYISADPEEKKENLALQKKLSNAEKKEDLEKGERNLFNHRNGIISYLGENEDKKPPEISIEKTRLQMGDVLLLTTDGIHDNLTDVEIEAVLRNYPNDPQGAADELIKKAYARSQDKTHMRAKPDDLTVLVVQIKK